MRVVYVAGAIGFLALIASSNLALAHKHPDSGGGTQVQSPPTTSQFHPPKQNTVQRTFKSTRTFSTGGNSTTRSFSSTRTFSTGTNSASTRSFSHSRSFGTPGGFSKTSTRRFGSTGSAGSSGGRHFGSNSQLSGSARRFGSNNSGGRHFGAAGFHGAPRRVAGAHYFYHGHSFGRFRAGYYRWPHGYHYVHYSVGVYFPRRYWVSDYYITDYADYGLDVPPPDFQWVRYGPDLVLFDLNSGAITQVIPGAFEETADGDTDDSQDGNDQGDQGGDQ